MARRVVIKAVIQRSSVVSDTSPQNCAHRQRQIVDSPHGKMDRALIRETQSESALHAMRSGALCESVMSTGLRGMGISQQATAWAGSL
ncbi:hypothetical protein [Niveibacterium umoris]|uniref:hypothetical protein n=1 Tax=Niveibacterium umoris TaxID=1193620 RepID=UPI001C85E9E7|nr:hypothetical protein [Niveibacterium umoris]